MENRVFVAGCGDYEQGRVDEAVERVLEGFGGAKAILETVLKSGAENINSKNKKPRVLVKPNLLIPKKPESAATTHPAVVEAVCRAFIKTGAEVFIIDSTGGPHSKMLLRLLYGKPGMKQAAKNSGAKLSFDTTSKSVKCINGEIIDQVDLLTPVMDADLVISVAKTKTHGFQAMTGCVKNMFGCVPGLGKPKLHRKFPKREDFAKMLVDVCLSVNPGFSILDAIIGMEGQGPASGDPKKIGAIIGGFSPYAVDVAQCYLMGLRYEKIYTINEAISRGLSPKNHEELEWLGDDPKPLKQNFKPAITHTGDKVPKILDNCTGCAVCIRICPMKCMKLPDKKAEIKEKDCICCYCCHEFCPEKAISLE